MRVEELKQPIYLFPFTAEAALMHHILKNHNIKTAGFLDNKKSLHSETYDGITFLAPENAAEHAPGATVIICGYRHYNHDENLRRLGFNNIVKIEKLFDRNLVDEALAKVNSESFNKLAPRQRFRLERLGFDIGATILPAEIRDDEDAIILNSATFGITTKCTLKCKNCSALIQYYDKPEHTSLEKLCEDIDLVFKHIDFAREIVLLGGETLLHPNLPEIIKYAHKYKDKYGIFRIVTNGTVVPSEKSLEIFRELGIFLKISDYGEKSRKKAELINAFEQYGILYQLEKIVWCEMQQLLTEPRNDSEYIFSKCFSKNVCCTVMNSRIYRCAFLAFAENLGAIPYSIENSAALKYGITKESLKKYLNNQIAMPGCNYCTGGDNDHPEVPVAEQTKEPLPYKSFHNYPPDFR